MKWKLTKDNSCAIIFFRKVFEVLELMKLDMANFTLQQARPLIQQHAVEYERAKFEDFLKMQQGMCFYSYFIGLLKMFNYRIIQ